jgi:heterodisulfide reductase subunit B
MDFTVFWGCLIPIKFPQIELAARKSLPLFDINLVDIEGYSCCPEAWNFKSHNIYSWLAIAARNLCLAEERGLDILTLCPGCTVTLTEARHILLEKPKLKDMINQRLKKIGKEFRGKVEVKNIFKVLRDDIGLEKIRETVKRSLDGIKVAIHYGCHLLKPSQVLNIDNSEDPHILEDMVSILGATPLAYQERLRCCGSACRNKGIPRELSYEKFTIIEKGGADCITLPCPTCFDEYDLGQIMTNRKYKTSFAIPIFYYLQLVALAQGFSAEELGIRQHKIKADKFLQKIA